MTNPLIIKLGGVLLENEEALNHFFSSLRKYRIKCQRFVIIIHGGGCLVDKLMEKLSLPVIKKDGLRITSHDQIYIITGALAGTANKILLAYAKKHGLNPIGLCLGDDNLVNVRQSDKELGYVGHVSTGNCGLLNNLLNLGYIPIVSSIGITDEGVILNTNADQAATALAATINADLILLSDVSGILDSKGNCISEITVEQAEQLIAQGIITNGMIVKVNAAINAARILSRPINIASWRHFEQLLILNVSNSISFGTKVSV